ncbi:MAG: hypothetical protein VCA57_15275 [Pseudomonas sp.]|uniref:hypothetical protein n=1 Tax=Pseudomonas sp. TaxID=306 RepID=UPI00398292CA
MDHLYNLASILTPVGKALDAQAEPKTADNVGLAGIPERLELFLPDEISVANVAPILNALATAPAGQKIELHLRHNGGGDVDQMIELIKNLHETKAIVEITFSRYVMSAAATIWLWFRVWPTERVQSLPPRKPGVVMYHRPRLGDGMYVCFTDEMDDGHLLKGHFEKKFKLFDLLFEEMYLRMLASGNEGQPAPVPEESKLNELNGLSYRHAIYRMRDSYYGNQDCLIPV